MEWRALPSLSATWSKFLTRVIFSSFFLVAPNAAQNHTSTYEICDALTLEGLRRGYREDCVAREYASGVLVELYRDKAAFNKVHQCKSYVLFPGENMWTQTSRAALYLLALLYCFLGIAIVADVFMNAIETITSAQVEVQIQVPMGTARVVKEAYWNPTIANLTLMALGSSAPEILLSVIGVVFTLGEEADKLGPATIVGSAAFNLLCISAVCIMAPAPSSRKIAEIGVFNVTAFFSVWAYIWLLIIVDFNSPEVIDLWEALVTFFQFPILVLVAYGQDRKWNFKRSNIVSPEEAAAAKVHDAEAALTLKYRMNAVRMITGGARLQLPKKTSPTAEFRDEENTTADKKAPTSDPYAIVKYNNIVKKSHWKIKNLNPRWLESFDFRVNDLTTVKVEVFDHDELSSDDFMGTCDISLDDLSRGTTKDMWVTLLGKNGDNTMHRGKVFIKLTLSDDGTNLNVAVVEGRHLIGLEKASKLDDLGRAAAEKARSMKAALAKTWAGVAADYKAQFQAALTFSGPTDEQGNVLPATGLDLLMHFLTVFWKMLFALIPPAEYYGGKLAFGVALIFIGGVTAIVGEIAGLFGCVVGLDEGVTAITFVALGTSLPDTFASKLAAVNEATADNAVGNVTGSNSVNVFLGIGLPWTIAALYAELTGTKFVARSNGFGLSVLVFIVLATLFIGLLYYRRVACGAELGGNPVFAKFCAYAASGAWMLYVIISSLRMYDHLGDLWTINGVAQPPPPPPWYAGIKGASETKFVKGIF